jgi:hypothetical protein
MMLDHPLKHPEKSGPLLSYVAAMAVGAFGAVWLWDGAVLSKLPGFAVLIAFMVALFAWWPLAYWAYPAFHRDNSVFMRTAFLLGFAVWGVALAAGVLVLFTEMQQ